MGAQVGATIQTDLKIFSGHNFKPEPVLLRTLNATKKDGENGGKGGRETPTEK